VKIVAMVYIDVVNDENTLRGITDSFTQNSVNKIKKY
jgi:hypothetical protein